MSPPDLHAPPAGFADPLYARIADLIYREAGIVLGPEKRGMMDSRLHRRIAANNCTSLADYVQRLDNGALAGERDHLGRDRPRGDPANLLHHLQELPPGLVDQRRVGGDAIQQARLGEFANVGGIGRVGKEFHAHSSSPRA